MGPLLPEITEALGLTGSASGLLTTLPLIAFAVVSPLTGGLGRRWGEGRIILAGLALILLGTVLRSIAGTAGLFLGTRRRQGGIPHPCGAGNGLLYRIDGGGGGLGVGA